MKFGEVEAEKKLRNFRSCNLLVTFCHSLFTKVWWNWPLVAENGNLFILIQPLFLIQVGVLVLNQDNSAASLCHQAAVCFSDKFCKLLFIEKSQNY